MQTAQINSKENKIKKIRKNYFNSKQWFENISTSNVCNVRRTSQQQVISYNAILTIFIKKTICAAVAYSVSFCETLKPSK